MKKYIVILSTILLPFFVEAQNVCYIKYTYDASGNRVQREFFCGAPDTTSGGTAGNGTTGGGGGTSSKRLPTIIQNPKGEDLGNYDFLVSPNPSNGKYKISLLNKELIGKTLEILNSGGIRILNQKLDNSQIWIDITQHANGVYYFYIRDEEHSKTKMVIKR